MKIEKVLYFEARATVGGGGVALSPAGYQTL